MIQKDSYQEEAVRHSTYYVGQLKNVFVEITPTKFAEDFHSVLSYPKLLQGEVILSGQFVEERFVPTAIHRLSLYGREEGSKDSPFRTLDLVGSSEQNVFEEIDEYNWEIGVRARLYYSRIGDVAFNYAIEGGKEETDAIHPPAETVVGELNFSIHQADSYRALFHFNSVKFSMSETLPDGGLIETLEVNFRDSIELFTPVDPPVANHKPANSLEASCDQTRAEFQMLPPCDSANRTKQRELGLKIINLTSMDNETIKPWCQHQLHQVCRIWCKKGALDLNVVGEILKWGNGENYDDAGVASLGQNTLAGIFFGIFIVDNLVTSVGQGSGVTVAAGTSEAYVVLDARKIDPSSLRFDENILAHELCHVLGLEHSWTAVGAHSLPGSPNSVVDPRNKGISSNNTQRNLSIFTATQLNPKVMCKLNDTGQPIWSCFDPD